MKHAHEQIKSGCRTHRSQVDEQLPDPSHFTQILDRSVLHLDPSGVKLGFEYDFDGSVVALQQVGISLSLAYMSLKSGVHKAHKGCDSGSSCGDESMEACSWTMDGAEARV